MIYELLQTILGFDFDEVMMIAMGFAGLAYILVDLKRERRLDQFALALAEDIATLKVIAGVGAPHTLAERVSELEARIEYAERIATLEARVDYQTPKITKRRSDGKFGSDKPPEAP